MAGTGEPMFWKNSYEQKKLFSKNIKYSNFIIKKKKNLHWPAWFARIRRFVWHWSHSLDKTIQQQKKIRFTRLTFEFYFSANITSGLKNKSYLSAFSVKSIWFWLSRDQLVMASTKFSWSSNIRSIFF
jgi:hypothetical protein